MLLELNDNVIFQQEDEYNSFFINLLEGQYIYNNETSTKIITLFLESNQFIDVIDNLSSTFNVECSILEKDVHELITLWCDLGLIKKVNL